MAVDQTPTPWIGFKNENDVGRHHERNTEIFHLYVLFSMHALLLWTEGISVGWDSNYASWNMIFNYNDKSVVDINGGHRVSFAHSMLLNAMTVISNRREQ